MNRRKYWLDKKKRISFKSAASQSALLCPAILQDWFCHITRICLQLLPLVKEKRMHEYTLHCHSQWKVKEMHHIYETVWKFGLKLVCFFFWLFLCSSKYLADIKDHPAKLDIWCKFYVKLEIPLLRFPNPEQTPKILDVKTNVPWKQSTLEVSKAIEGILEEKSEKWIWKIIQKLIRNIIGK